MTVAYTGQPVTLTVEFYEYPGGPLDDVTSLTITITGSSGTVLAQTAVGITHVATGVYSYSWTPSSGLPVGAYTVVWSATEGSASEVVTVITSTPASFTGSAWYTTREKVKADLDFKETARTNRIVDRAIAGATRSIQGEMRRKFFPRYATAAFDWPANPRSRSYRLWLDENEFISVDTITVDGVEIPSSSYLLYPSDGPPYDCIELDRNSSATFSSGTLQQGVLATGWLGYTDDQEDAGTITASLDDETTTVLVSDSVSIGVGSMIEVDAERMAVVDKRMVDTTQNLTSDLDDEMSVDTVPVSSGAAFTEGEVIMIGSERMLIEEIAGNNLIVQRAWDGSTLAAHTNGADVYAPRSLRVKRGAFGTTATDHADDSAITVWVVPELLEELCAAEAINTILQKNSGYSRRMGSGEGEREASGRALKELRARAEVLYGRVLS